MAPPEKTSPQVNTRPINMLEMFAVLAHVKEKVEKKYEGQDISEAQKKVILQQEFTDATGVKPALGSVPTEVASTHEEKVKAILKEQSAKHPDTPQKFELPTAPAHVVPPQADTPQRGRK